MVDVSTPKRLSIVVLEYTVVISMVLGGIIFSNIVSYFRRYPKDHIYLKIFVGALWAAEFAQSLITACSLTHLSTWHIDYPDIDPSFPESVSRYLIVSFICSGVIMSMVQGFFSHRLRVLTDSWALSSICWLLIFLRCIGIIVLGVIPLKLRSPLLQWLGTQKAVISTILAISIVIDIIVTAALTVVLHKRKNVGFSSLQQVVNRLITWSIMSGLVTTLLTTVILILSVIKESVLYFSLFLLLSRVFGLIFILSLNEREMLRRLDLTAGNSPSNTGPLIFAVEPSTASDGEARAQAGAVASRNSKPE